MANRHRGEVDIRLGGKDYTLRPTFEAIVEAEDRAKSTVFEMLQDLGQQSVPLRTLAAVIFSGILGANDMKKKDCPTFDEVGRFIRSEGSSNFIEPVVQWLTNALASDDELRKQAEEQSLGK